MNLSLGDLLLMICCCRTILLRRGYFSTRGNPAARTKRLSRRSDCEVKTTGIFDCESWVPFQAPA